MSASEEEVVSVRKRLYNTPSPSPPSSPQSLYIQSPERLDSSSPSPSPGRFYSLSPSSDDLPSSSPSPVRLFTASPGTRKRRRSRSPVRSSSPSESSSPDSPCHLCNSSPSYSPNRWQKDLISTTADSAPVTPSSLSTSFLADTLSGKVLFLYFSHVIGPVVASLYAISLWNPSVFSSDINCDHAQPTHIEPIIEFGCKEFPTAMSCVELNSKLYFIGGSPSTPHSLSDSLSRPLLEEEDEEPRKIRVEEHSLVDLYVLDMCHAIYCCRSDTSSSSSSPGTTPGSNTSSSSSSSSNSTRWSGASSNLCQMLKKGPPMHSWKHCPYAFVAFGKIYVISGIRFDPVGDPSSLDRFEVFDPESDKWTVLDDPPLDDAITSHSVIGDRIYISTSWGLMYSYDPHKGKWRPCWANHSFYGKADSIGTTLYGWNYYTGVTAYGLFTAEGVSSSTKARASSAVAYLNRTKDMMPLLLMIGETDYSYNCSPPCLVHLGNRVFCYVVLRNFPDSDGPNKRCYKVAIRVTHFELPQDPYRSTVKEGKDTDREFLFDFKFINSAYFVGKSRYGSYEHALQNCFHMPIQ